jgi:hypothetical protein
MNNLDKQYQDLLDEMYKKYADSHWTPPSNPKSKLLSDQLFSVVPMEHSKESFINKIKTDDEFSKRWGLKIEERELSVKERLFFVNKSDDEYNKALSNKEQYVLIGLDFELALTNRMNEMNIPTKLITITYNDKTIESYEHIG